MDEAQSDLIESYKLETEFFRDHVRHTSYGREAGDRYEEGEEDWKNCGELGTGGFGVVHKQIQEATGRYRAVKTIDKRKAPGLDYSRELLVMAILAKHPSRFVQFLGWFERPETLYIAMEYCPEGDLAQHIGPPLPQETVQNILKQALEGLKVMHQEGITHRDLKPANIFVVSMSPVRVKLGDFGSSKRIRSQSITTLHTQVSTQPYAAPEVLGLDSNSETSDYTNSVDIWSLGCVIYELLVGAMLFPSVGQASRYFFGLWPFPEDTLKGLSPPTDDIGISLLKSMLQIQPERRPTAAEALGHAWFVNLKSDNECSRHDVDKGTQSRNEGTPSRKRKNKPVTHKKSGKRKRKKKTIVEDDASCTPGGIPLGVNAGFQRGGGSTTPKAIIDTSVISLADAPSAEIPEVQTKHQKPEPILTTRSKGPNAPGKQAGDIPPCPQCPRKRSADTRPPPGKQPRTDSRGKWPGRTPQRKRTRSRRNRRPRPAAGEIAEARTAQQSIHCKTLTPESEEIEISDRTPALVGGNRSD